MFAEIKEGLRVYKEALEDYLRRCEEIGNREKESRLADDYRGSVDWTREAREWKDAAGNRLDGMAAALGLSVDERTSIAKNL
jgi:hypothetical protein